MLVGNVGKQKVVLLGEYLDVDHNGQNVYESVQTHKYDDQYRLNAKTNVVRLGCRSYGERISEAESACSECDEQGL